MSYINLNAVEDFFHNPEQRMPYEVQRLILSGNTLKYNDLESKVIEWQWLNDMKPNLANKIDASTTAQNIPALWKKGTRLLLVYNPHEGSYVGQAEY